MKEINRFYSKMNGSTFCNSQDILRNMNTGDKVIAQREPENPYDSNAICLYDDKNQKLGYLPAETSASLAKKIDNKNITITVIVAEITGRDKKYVGCNLLVTAFNNEEE